MSDEQTINWLISIATLVAYGLYDRPTKQDECPILKNNFSKLVVIMSLFFFIISAYPRIVYATSITMGTFIFEEVGASIIYISKLITGEKTYSGATQIVYAVLLDWWRTLGGMSVAWARSLSAVIGVLGIFIYYFAIKRLTNKNLALLTAALISAGLYSSFFSRVAIETGWVLTVLALNIYAFSSLKNAPKLRYYLFGITIALGIFTYPGYSIGLASAVMSLLLTVLIYKKNIILPTVRSLIRPTLFTAFGILSISIPAAIFHYKEQSHAPFLFGGGVMANSNVTYLDSLLVQLHDIFVQSTSYYLPFSNYAFVEASLWGFFIIATWFYVFRKRDPIYTALLFVCITMPFFVAIAKNYPGMRRGVMFLAPFYFISGTGIYLFISALEASLNKLKQSLGVLLLILVLGAAAYAHYDTARGSSHFRPYTQLNEILQNHDYKFLLEKFNVVFVMDDLDEFQLDYINHHTNLLNRYEPSNINLTKSLNVQKSTQVLKLSKDRQNLIITNNPDNLQRFTSDPNLCMTQIRKLQTLYFPFYASEAAPIDSPFCKSK